jgi:hypothetical protein
LNTIEIVFGREESCKGRIKNGDHIEKLLEAQHGSITILQNGFRYSVA